MNNSKVTPEVSAKNDESQTVTESDLEVNYLSYALAVVLNAPKESDSYDAHVGIVNALRESGLRVAILNTTSESKDHIVVLVDAFDDGEVGSTVSDNRTGSRQSAVATTQDVVNGKPNCATTQDVVNGKPNCATTQGGRRRVSTVLGSEIEHVRCDLAQALGIGRTDETRPQHYLAHSLTADSTSCANDCKISPSSAHSKEGKVSVESSRVSTVIKAPRSSSSLRECTDAHQSSSIHGNSSTSITASEELALLYRVVERALFHINVDDTGNHLDFHVIGHDHKTKVEQVICDIFPLHDEIWNDKFKCLLFQNKHARPDMSTMARLVSWITQPTNTLYIDHIRKQFGDRIFTYFHFMLFYTRWVQILAGCCSVYYITVRFANWGHYVSGLGVIGYFISSVWGPLLSRSWERYSKSLAFETTMNHVLMPPKYIANPHISRKMKDSTWSQRAWVRQKVSWLGMASVVVNVILLLIVCVLFIQWYIYGKMSPTCDCCKYLLESGLGNSSISVDQINQTLAPSSCDWFFEHPEYLLFETAPKECTLWQTCFNSYGSAIFTDRWVYILLQGICLGLVLDIGQSQLFKLFTEWLTRLEGWETLELHNRHLTRKQFFFTWINMFAWFLILAFFYVPFGSSIQRLLSYYGYGIVVPPWGWRQGMVSLDEAFVTPMIVTALLNFAIDTFIPTLISKAAVNAKKARKEMLHLTFLKKMQAVEVEARSRALKLAVNAEKHVADTLHHLTNGHISTPLHMVSMVKGGEGHTTEARNELDIEALTESSAAKLASKQNGQQVGGTTSLIPSQSSQGNGTSSPSNRGIKSSESSERQALKKLNVSTNLLSTSCKSEQEQPRLAGNQEPVMWFEGVSCDHGMNLFNVILKHREVHETRFPVKLFHVTPDSNSLDATEVLTQSRLSEFNENRELVDIALQFGYISMFTSCWALLPFAAAGKLLFEFRGDIFRLLFASKRRIPMASQLNIGEIQNSLMITSFLSICTVSIMLVLSTGALDHWVRVLGLDMECKADQESLSMMPDFDDCTGTLSWGVRVTVALALEHVGIGLLLLVIVQIPGTPAALNDLKDQKEKQARKHALTSPQRLSYIAGQIHSDAHHGLDRLNEGGVATPDQVRDIFKHATQTDDEEILHRPQDVHGKL